MYRVSYNPMNGRLAAGPHRFLSYDGAELRQDGNFWSSSENNSTNSWNANFSNGNINNNNKYNGNVVRAVTASLDCAMPASFVCSVWEAYENCLKGKMRSKEAVEYMKIAAEDIPKLAYELWTATYSPGTSTAFLVYYPKMREVFAASFRDRIVHHWIILRLEPLFEERFISQGNVSFNCRKGFGTEKAVQYVNQEMKIISDNYNSPAWVFRGDLVGFFMSIDKEQLWYLIRRFIVRWRKRYEREGWRKLEEKGLGTEMPEPYWDILLIVTKVVIMHHPERDCILNTNPEEWLKMDKNKSLFTSTTGEPIGNLTTQQFANFLMSFFVIFIKWQFRRKKYFLAQFVDDFVIGCTDKRAIIESIPKIEKFFWNTLKLNMHKDKRYLQAVSHGILFVGTYIKPGRMYLSNRTIRRMRRKLSYIRKLLEGKELTPSECSSIEQIVNSYLGFCRNRKTYNIRKDAIEMIGCQFWRYFYVKGSFQSIRAKKSSKICI